MENKTQEQQVPLDPMEVLGFGKIELPKQPAEEKKPAEVIETPLMKVELKPDDLFKKVTQETGLTIENEESLISTLKKLKDFDTREKELAEANLKGQQYIQFIDTMPEDLKRIVVAYGSGENYADVIKQVYGLGDISFSKSWGDYDDKLPLIKKYTDADVSEWEELDEKSQKALEKAARTAYEKDRTTFNEMNQKQRSDWQANVDNYANNLKDSVKKTMAKLRTDFPDLAESKFREVENALYGRPLQTIYDDKGLYREDAATKIALANYGQETIQTIMAKMNEKAIADVEKARKEASQGKLEEHIKAANDKVPAAESAEDKTKLNEALDKFGTFISNNSGSQFINKNSGKT